jgi:hypothetical protein
MVWVELERTAARVALLRGRTGWTAEQLAVLEQCDQKLDLARAQLDRTPRCSFSFWELIHQIDALLVKVEPLEALVPIALKARADMERLVRDAGLRQAWLGTGEKPGPLPLLIERIAPRRESGQVVSAAPLTEQEEAELRAHLQGALKLVNRQRDTGFWQLGTNVSIYLLSAVLLLLLGAGTQLWVMLEPQASAERIGIVAMLGAAGAVIANMLVKEPFVASVGPTTRYFVYNLFAKPVLGAFSAIAFILLERSGMIFQIVAGGGPGSAPVRIEVGELAGARRAALALIAITAGFFAEKAFRPLMDQVMRKLFAGSERYMTAEDPAKGAESGPRS